MGGAKEAVLLSGAVRALLSRKQIRVTRYGAAAVDSGMGTFHWTGLRQFLGEHSLPSVIYDFPLQFRGNRISEHRQILLRGQKLCMKIVLYLVEEEDCLLIGLCEKATTKTAVNE